MYSHGALYTIVNGNLMFHGCIPMDEDGNFENCTVNGVTASGKAYMDFLDSELRKAYFSPDESGGDRQVRRSYVVSVARARSRRFSVKIR